VRHKRYLAISTVVVAGLGVGGGIAVAGAADDDAELPMRGEELERASRAALAHVGGGRVTETEVGDEDSYYEVEVTLDDGRQVDVQLDRAFRVVGSEADVEDDPGDAD